MALSRNLARLLLKEGRRLFTFLVIFLLAGEVWFPAMVSAGEKDDVREAIVKIFTIRNRPDYTNPWNMFGPSSVNGSGCVIKGNRILTNAHVVSDQTFIQVRLFGQSKKFEAEVVAVSHEADLALLTVKDEGFFKGVNPLEIGELPQTQEDVVVYGFPQGGETISTTKGVVSRIEHQVYAHSFLNMLAVQIDAAMNMGSSGGPVLLDDKVVGVAMQYIGDAENIGYMVPPPIINHFLEDLEDGGYDGFPDDGIICQTMDNDGLRKKYGMKAKQSGCLVYRIIPGSPALGRIFPEDVIMKVDGHVVADNGTVEFRPKERTGMNYFTQLHQIGEDMVFEILRDGKVFDVKITLTERAGVNQLVPLERYDVRPTYYIYGGLVFSPLTVNYLKTWGNTWYNSAPKNLVARYQYDQLARVGEEIVNLARVLPAKVNKGYHQFGDYRVTKVNDKEINNLRDLIRIIETGKEPFVVFTDRWGAKVVLDREAAEKENADILKKYRIPIDRSADLM